MSTTAEAKALLRQGRVAEAEQLFDQILQRSPDNVEALNAVALASLRRADSRRSVELLVRAVTLQPGDALSHYHLGRAHSVAGDLMGALQSYASAIRLLPDFHVARLHYAESLDRAGDMERAPLHYLRALQDAQQQGHSLGPASTPPRLQPIVTRGVQLVREARRAMCAQLLGPLQEKFGAAAVEQIGRAHV